MLGASPFAGRFLDILATLDFDRRYYAHCQAREAPPGPVFRAEQAEHAVEGATGLPFKVHEKENFLAFKETTGALEWGLNLAPGSGRLEMILVFETPSGHVGGTFQGMARRVALRREGVFTRHPPCPRPCYNSLESLAESAVFAVGLYRDVKEACLAAGGCEEKSETA